MTALLLLVDLQRDYLDSPGLEPADGIVVERAADLLESCRGAGVRIAHAWTTVSRDDDRRMSHWKRDGRWLCEEGTPGHAPPAVLEAAEGEPIVHKAAYSAFEDGALERLLTDREVDLLIVAGVHLHACVRQTVLDAYRLAGTEIWVAEEATASDDPVHAAITRRYLEGRGTRFLTNAEIRAALADGGPSGAANSTDAAAAAVRECRQALPAWRRAGPAARAEVLESLAGALRAEAPGLGEQMAVEIGKPVAYGAVEVERTAEMLEAVARRTLESAQARNGDAEVRRRPLGVVAAVTPWNNPVYIALGKIAPALAFGNAVAWKPAPAASLLAEHVAGLLSDAGLPEGALSLLPGGRAEGAALMAAEGVDAVTVTGSSAAGFAAQEVCSRRRIPLQAELGGNNAALVWEDAELERAAREIAEGAFAQAGQRCTANRRVVVHRSVRSRLLALLVEETAALAWGDPRERSTQVGPLISVEARDRVAAAVARAGGTVTAPTQAPPVPDASGYEGRWYPPTILTCDEPSEEIVQEETFGPVLVVQEAEGWNDAVELVNGVRQGLAAALFSTSPEVWERFLEEAEAGILKLNRSTADAEVDVPFGGWKQSGIGPPEHGSFDRDFYTRPQAVYR